MLRCAGIGSSISLTLKFLKSIEILSHRGGRSGIVIISLIVFIAYNVVYKVQVTRGQNKTRRKEITHWTFNLWELGTI